MAPKRESFAWAYDEHLAHASPDVEEGLRYARRLAEMARLARKAALAGEDPPFPLTPADIAFEEGIAEETVRERISLARFALWGTLSDSGIYARKARIRERAEQPVRLCKAPDCEEPLPPRATKRRAYCHPRCKRRHFYQRAHPEALPAPSRRGPRTNPDLTREELQRIYEQITDPRRWAEDEEY